MKHLVVGFALIGLFSSAAWAGVVIEMEVTDSTVVRESKLQSITRDDLEESIFAVPSGYQIKNLTDEMNKGR